MRRQRLRFAVIAATVVFGGLAAMALAVAGTASASYKAKITGGVLTFTGNAASDKLVLRLKPGGETKLQGDVGGNGTAEFESAAASSRRSWSTRAAGTTPSS